MRLALSTTIALGALSPGADAQVRPAGSVVAGAQPTSPETRSTGAVVEAVGPPWTELGVRPLLPATSLVSRAFRSHSATTSGPLPSPSASDLPLAAGQQRRLPVYDDDGEVIRIEEIAMGVDPSGAAGAFWGGLFGFAGGALFGSLMINCGERRGSFQHYCSPRENALRDVLPIGLGITMGLVAAWVGWEGDVTTWDESLEEIRRRRRVGR